MTEFLEMTKGFEKAGSFFCEACLIGKPTSEASPDPRYCQDCYDFLTEEAKLLSGTRRPKWVPKPEKPLILLRRK